LRDYVIPIFGKLSVQAITRDLILDALRPICRDKPETAGRLRGRIEAILDYAEAHGYRAEGTNPARLGPIETILGSRSRRVKNHASLDYREISSFLTELKTKEGIAARAMEFCIATAVRTNEVIGALEIDLEARTWTIPADRMKAKRDHRVPLSKAAIAILQAMEEVRESEFVFPGPTRAKLSNMAMLMLLRRMGHGELSVHGFRSTFRTWGAERTNFPREVLEAALAHVTGNAVEQAYQRGELFEKRRKLMDAWSEFCAAPVNGKVLPIRA
jgi:integrase